MRNGRKTGVTVLSAFIVFVLFCLCRQGAAFAAADEGLRAKVEGLVGKALSPEKEEKKEKGKESGGPFVVTADAITKDIEIRNVSGSYIVLNITEYIDNELIREEKNKKLSHRHLNENEPDRRVYQFDPLWEEHLSLVDRKVISIPKTDRSGPHEWRIVVEESGGGFKVEKKIKFRVEDKTLNVARVRQSGEVWCWAASLQSILNYMGDPEIKACELVNRARECKWIAWEAKELVSGHVDCCKTGPTGQACDFGLPVDSWIATSVQDVIELKGYSMKYQRKAMTDEQIKGHIDSGKPLIIMISPHMMVARGYRSIEDENGNKKLYLHIMDPLLYPHYGVVAYEDLVNDRYLGCKWVGIVYDIKRSNAIPEKEMFAKVVVDVPNAFTGIPFQARLIGMPAGKVIEWSSTADNNISSFKPIEGGVASDWTISKTGKYMITAKFFSDEAKKDLIATVVSGLFQVSDLKPFLQLESYRLDTKGTSTAWEQRTTVVEVPVYSPDFGKPLKFSLVIPGLDVERMSVEPLWQFTDKEGPHAPGLAKGTGTEFRRADFDDLTPYEVNIKKGMFLVAFTPKEYKGSYQIQAFIRNEGHEVKSNIVQVNYGDPLRLSKKKVSVGETLDAYLAAPEESARLDYGAFQNDFTLKWSVSPGAEILPSKDSAFNSRTVKALKSGTHSVALELYRAQDRFKINYSSDWAAEGDLRDQAKKEKSELEHQPKDQDAKSAMLREIEAYLNQFKETCFGQYISLGDIGLFHKAASQRLRLIVGDKGKALVEARGEGFAYHDPEVRRDEPTSWLNYFNAAIVFPFDPRHLSSDPEERFRQQQTMVHEMTHHMEWLQGIKAGKKPWSERNTDYQDLVVIRLRKWVDIEKRIRECKSEPECQFNNWKDVWKTLRGLEAGDGITPDEDLQKLTGFHARIDDIRQGYRDGNCDGKCKGGLGKLASFPPNFEAPSVGECEKRQKKSEETKGQERPEEDKQEKPTPEQLEKEKREWEEAERTEQEKLIRERLEKEKREQGQAEKDRIESEQTAAQEQKIREAQQRKGPQTCTYQYSEWGECGSATRKQIRSITGMKPEGCVEKDKPALEQECMPPATAQEMKGRLMECLCDVGYKYTPDECAKAWPGSGGVCSYSGPLGGFFCHPLKSDSAEKAKCYEGVYGKKAGSAELSQMEKDIRDATKRNIKPLKVTLSPDVKPIKAQYGTTVSLTANVEGGLPGYTYSWSGQGSPKDNTFSFINTRKPGTYAVSVTVNDSDGGSATAATSIVVGAMTVTIEKTLPAGNTVPVGGQASFRAAVTGAADVSYLWQPHPEVEFNPFEKSATTTATFRNPGSVGVWVEVLVKEGAAMRSAGRSDVITMQVANPQWALEFIPAGPRVGQPVKAKISPTGPVAAATNTAEMNFRWQLPVNVKQTGTSQGDREITLVLTDTKPANISCTAATKRKNENLGGAGKTITAKGYEVKVSGPRGRQEVQIWKCETQLGGAPACGMKKVENQLAVGNEILFGATVEPMPEKPASYNWTVSPAGCSIASPFSREMDMTCSSTGTYTVTVIAKSDGMAIGSSSASVSVTISQNDINNSDKSKEAYEKLQKARELVTRGKLDEGIDLAGAALNLDPKNAEAKSLQPQWQKERLQVQQQLEQMRKAILGENLQQAGTALAAARQVHPKYAPVVAAAAEYEKFQKEIAEAARVKKENADAMTQDGDLSKVKKIKDDLIAKGATPEAAQEAVDAAINNGDFSKLNKLNELFRNKNIKSDLSRQEAKPGKLGPSSKTPDAGVPDTGLGGVVSSGLQGIKDAVAKGGDAVKDMVDKYKADQEKAKKEKVPAAKSAEAAKVKNGNAGTPGAPAKKPDDSASRENCAEEKTVLHNNYQGACGRTQSTSFTLAEDTNITRIRIWYDPSVGGKTFSAALSGPNGYKSTSGKIAKGGCYAGWCEAIWNLNQVFKAGTYAFTADSKSVCSDPSGRTTLVLYGCAVQTRPPAPAQKPAEKAGDRSVVKMEESAEAKAKASYCKDYTVLAISRQNENLQKGCGYQGRRWHTDYNTHYNGCLQVSTKVTLAETQERYDYIKKCEAEEPSERPTSADVPIMFCHTTPELGNIHINMVDSEGTDYGWLALGKTATLCAGYKVKPGHYRVRVSCYGNKKDPRNADVYVGEYKAELDVVAGRNNRFEFHGLKQTRDW